MTASVLVVEDERKIRDLLGSYLKHDGLTVITTGSGAEAIQLARDTAPDLIVLDLIIDEARRQVTAAGHIGTLTATEWKLLTTLASVPGRVYSRYELINRIRGYEYDGYEHTIDSHIRNLRQKIETDPHAPRLVETVTGAGYRLAITRGHQPAAAAPRSPDAERDNPRPG
jgi:DNA-binding response OmpR family regulator